MPCTQLGTLLGLLGFSEEPTSFPGDSISLSPRPTCTCRLGVGLTDTHEGKGLNEKHGEEVGQKQNLLGNFWWHHLWKGRGFEDLLQNRSRLKQKSPLNQTPSRERSKQLTSGLTAHSDVIEGEYFSVGATQPFRKDVFGPEISLLPA